MTTLLIALLMATLPQASVSSYTIWDHCEPDDPGARWCDGVTSSGAPAAPHVSIACPRPIACPAREGVTFYDVPEVGLALGTEVWIEGLGVRPCHDRGHDIYGERFDRLTHDRDDALRWGRRGLRYLVIQGGKGSRAAPVTPIDYSPAGAFPADESQPPPPSTVLHDG